MCICAQAKGISRQDNALRRQIKWGKLHPPLFSSFFALYQFPPLNLTPLTTSAYVKSFVKSYFDLLHSSCSFSTPYVPLYVTLFPTQSYTPSISRLAPHHIAWLLLTRTISIFSTHLFSSSSSSWHDTSIAVGIYPDITVRNGPQNFYFLHLLSSLSVCTGQWEDPSLRKWWQNKYSQKRVLYTRKNCKSLISLSLIFYQIL